VLLDLIDRVGNAVSDSLPSITSYFAWLAASLATSAALSRADSATSVADSLAAPKEVVVRTHMDSSRLGSLRGTHVGGALFSRVR